MKKLMLLLAALLALVTICALAEEAEPTVYTSGDWEYVLLEDGTAEIAGYYGYAVELIVPVEIDGYAVTSIGDEAFYYCDSLTSVTIPDTVTAIGTNPFESCGELVDIIVSPDHPTLATIDGVLFDKMEKKLICYPKAYTSSSYAVPQGIRAIGGYAFNNCDSLTSITIPDSVTAIGDGAFSSCYSLTSVTLPDSVTAIRDWAFSSCYSLTSVTLPDSVTAIGDGAFSSCYSLTSITLPDSVTAIGANPFVYCENLTDIIVSPDHPTLATIDGVLFDKTEKKLICFPMDYANSNYTIPQGILAIGNYAFLECSYLTSITLPDTITTIGDCAFGGCESLMNVMIPDAVTSIGDGAFIGCYLLTSITLPDSITSIGDEAFADCSSLTSITLPNSITSIGDEVFAECLSLTSITLPDTITAIGDYAFGGCESLTNVMIPDVVTFIGDGAFYGCYVLTSITLPDNVTSIGDDAFDECPLTSITVPRGSYAEEWALAHGYTCTYVKPTGRSHGDLTYRIQTDGSAIIVRCTTEAAKLEVPAAIEGAPVTAIGAYAFEGCTTLTGVTLPDTIAAIADTAFEGCGRITFTVPRDSYARQWCKENNLRYTYPDSLDWLLD